MNSSQPPKAWQSQAVGSGGHQTDSKTGVSSLQKASIEGTAGKKPDPLWDYGHYRIGSHRPSQEGESGVSRLNKTNSITRTKRKPWQGPNLKVIGWGSFSGATNHAAPRGARAQTAT